MTAPTPAARPRADWEAVERDYRLGSLTLRELEAKHGASRAAIARRARAQSWTRDLTGAVRQATSAALIERMVQSAAADGQERTTDAVLAAAEVNVRVITSHRAGLARLQHVKAQLLEQIEQAAAQMPELAEVIEMVRQADDSGVDRANDALKRAMGRSSLIDDLKKLAEIDERVRKGEREAFGVDSSQGETGTVEDMLRRIAQD